MTILKEFIRKTNDLEELKRLETLQKNLHNKHINNTYIDERIEFLTQEIFTMELI